MSFSYVESNAQRWLALAARRRLLVVDHSAANDVSSLWRVVDSAPLGSVLSTLVGVNVMTAPSFALIEWDDDLVQGAAIRSFTRGELTLRVVKQGEKFEQSGRSLLTWQEYSADGVTGISVLTDDYDSHTDTAHLPLEAGVCWVSAIHVSDQAEPCVSPLTHTSEMYAVTDASVTVPRRARRAQTGSVGQQSSQNDFTFTVAGSAPQRIEGVVVIGRSPQAASALGAEDPQLVTVEAPDHDISRSHVQFCVEGGSIVVTDLKSRNGTVLREPGKSPRTIGVVEPTEVAPGSVLELGQSVRVSLNRASASIPSDDSKALQALSSLFEG